MSRRLQLPRASFRPKGAMRITVKGIPAEVFAYHAGGKPYAVAFSGKRNRPDFHFSFKSEQRRAAHVKEYFDKLAKLHEYKSEQATKRREFRHTFKVGDVLHGSWGYDQTNCEFYQVTETTAHSITFRALGAETVEGSEGHMCESLTPRIDDLRGEAVTKRPQYPGHVTMNHHSLTLWDGRPKYSSWYA